MNSDAPPDLRRHLSLVLTIALAGCLAACFPMAHRTIPAANPRLGDGPRGELRIPSKDERLQKDCALAGDWYCLDSFYRIESADSSEVVVRYRAVAMTAEQARLEASQIRKMVLITEDGRKVRAKLSSRFEVRPLPILRYEDDGYVKTGRVEYVPQADGRVIRQDETTIGTVRRKISRVIGSSYIVFQGADLISPGSKRVVIEFEKGLLGGGARWVFDFIGTEVRNAKLATNEPRL
ncbi:MAG: hypothetical protein IPQ07_17000 [Myxococcales bacterium]|nr:hypothetical protein [Myxococcales bacterium]